MAPSSHSGELWGHHLMPSQLDVDFLLPNGIIIRQRCNRDATLEQVKANLWKEAKQYPLNYILPDKLSNNIFVGINQDAENEEFYDETRRLCDLRLFQPILRVVEPQGNREEKMLNTDISNTIGVPMNEFQEIRNQNLEIMTFQRNMLLICKDIVKNRESSSDARAKYVYTSDVAVSCEPPPVVRKRLESDKGQIMICVWVVSNDGGRQKYTVKVHHKCTPADIVAEAIRKRTKKMNMSEEDQEKSVRDYRDRYVLKVCGCDHFLLDEASLYSFRYIRRCLMRDQIPQLMLMSRDGLYENLGQSQFLMPSYIKMGGGALDMIKQQQTQSLWEVEHLLLVKILWATYVNVKDKGSISVRVGVFHGSEALCSPRDTKSVDASNPKWNESLTFELDLRDIPRSARLCISLFSVSKKNKQVLGWCNLNLFDFNGRLLADKVSMRLWPFPHGHEELLYPIGIPGTNYFSHDVPTLDLEFEHFRNPVAYPSDKEVHDFVAKTTKVVASSKFENQEEKMQFENILKRDPLAEISEQEKEMLWRFRYYCQDVYPESLPKLLTAVKWNSREDVAQLYWLLTKWQFVSVETALELLYCSYPDIKVRQFAVTSLETKITHEQLILFMPQLVQVLKFEPYLDNGLTKFLLSRGLANQRVGHMLFWHLRAEIHQPYVRLRFGLILEVYCRGCGAYVKSLHRQVEALDKLTKLSNLLKAEREECQLRTLQTHLQQADYVEALQNIHSPLDMSYVLGNLKVDYCQVMQSAKKPLKLAWTNPDPMAELYHKDFQIIFKNGDERCDVIFTNCMMAVVDLRQDMLTLQMFKLMEDIWQKENLDIWMLPYGCLATGQDVGVIEVVRNSKTVMKIQNEMDAFGALKMSGKQLHQWIKDQNADSRVYDAAVDTFTKSCAGYCVATFILGIGDRHPDNIMVTEEGQVFHIDFGHFLNHRKKKFGICRERVPFVLTDDFMKVISKGEDPKKSPRTEKFMKFCGDAYMKLRLHSREIITLFLLMVTAGITEMQSVDDLDYLRKTLAVDRSDDEAEEYFLKKFSEAYEGAWNTKLDWLFHWAKANTKRK